MPEANAAEAKPGRRWLKITGFAGAGLLALVVATTAALWWWAGTDGSLATALRWTSRSQPLTAGRVTGSLRAGGHIDQLRWQQNGLGITARDVSLAWQPWSLLHGTLKFDRLAAASVQVNDQRPTAAPSTPPAALRLPLPVTLDAFSAGELQWAGTTAFKASDISGQYHYTGLEHRLDLKNAQVAGGRYSGRAVLNSTAPLMLDASLTGALEVNPPGSAKPVPLAFQATASGPLTELLVKAELQVTQSIAAKLPHPHASVAARVMPWAAQPLPQADATFRDLDISALWPDTPQTLLTGSATLRPLQKTGVDAADAWGLQLQLANALPGAWDQKRLPVERLDTQGEWRNGSALVRSLKAKLGGGELQASGNWASGVPAGQVLNPGKAVPAPAWKLDATLRHINPAQLHTQLTPLPLDGQAEVHGQGTTTSFDASLQSTRNPGIPDNRQASRTRHGTKNLLQQFNLRDARTTGSWNAAQSGGTLTLSALRVRSADAELSGQLEVQPAAKGGKGKLALTAPGMDARLNGELSKTSGGGELSLQSRDAAQALRWLQKLPGMPAALLGASASGGASLQASWQGGWQDPALQVQLDAASLDWQTGTSAITAESAATASPGLLKIRALQATLSGRLSQAQLNTRGSIEVDQRRYALQLAADGGRITPAGASSPALGDSAWQGVLRQLSVGFEDPALGGSSWQLATRSPVSLKWTPTHTGGAFESGAGEALLTAPPGKAVAAATPSQATLAWRPVRWRPGELVTAGRITGLPMAWLELLAGPQLASTGLGGNLVLDGHWDAVLGDTLTLKAGLTRGSGDISVQTEGVQGNSARVAAGVKQASVTLENVGDALTLAVRWDSERAGTADGQLKTRLARAPAGDGMGGWLWPVNAPLEGRVHAQLPRIGVWSLLAPPGWRIRGSLAADITVSGTRAAPMLAGDLQASDLALRSVVDGIEFGNGRLRARLDGTRLRIDEFTLQGAGDKSTGGTLTARGDAGWVDGKPQVLLDATLQRLRASIRTDRQITVSGAVQASLKGNQTALTGKLVLDQARIILPNEGTPALGDDVVVRTPSGAATGQKAPEKTSAEAADKAGAPLKLAMLIDLGSDFRIRGKGIDTRVRGTLMLDGDSLRGPRLTGTVNTSDGQYRAYGQRLDIEQGMLRFTGAIDNPALDILAIRPNLTQRVGVQITGTALLPSVRLYAQPELPDAEKLSWLVVGRASAAGGAEAALLQQAALALLGSKAGGMSGGLAASLGLDELSFRGSASNADGTTSGSAVTLGKRFSRNFYAAYERSISGALGTLYVFYDLSQRFTLRAQAGQQSAVDLIFTIAYD